MFTEITGATKKRMQLLEQIDARDRIDGTETSQRLKQIPPETGKFLALLAANCPDHGEFVEIGTSAGYSSLWISLALQQRGAKLKTFEILPEKIRLAQETFRAAGVTDRIELIEGDFLEKGKSLGEIAFCFLDCEKHIYVKCFDMIATKLVRGGLLIADNAIDHADAMKPLMEKAQSDDRFDCLTVPIGKGEFVCRRK
jgi:predicted O-methyltransferase YrrM